MGYAQDLVNAGYVGYQGWPDLEAANDFAATGGKGKEGGGGAIGFDFVAESEKAYGEMGPYYSRLLSESQGDLNTALSRLVEDYETGERYIKQEEANVQRAREVAQKEGTQNVTDNALARGLYQKSVADPSGGMGIPDTEQKELEDELARRGDITAQGFARQREQSLLGKTRRETDLKKNQSRYEFDLEQQRRKEAAELAGSREARAYNRYNAQLV